MVIRKCKGCLYGLINTINENYLNNIPENFVINQQNRDDNKYHITIINFN